MKSILTTLWFVVAEDFMVFCLYFGTAFAGVLTNPRKLSTIVKQQYLYLPEFRRTIREVLSKIWDGDYDPSKDEQYGLLVDDLMDIAQGTEF